MSGIWSLLFCSVLRKPELNLWPLARTFLKRGAVTSTYYCHKFNSGLCRTLQKRSDQIADMRSAWVCDGVCAMAFSGIAPGARHSVDLRWQGSSRLATHVRWFGARQIWGSLGMVNLGRLGLACGGSHGRAPNALAVNMRSGEVRSFSVDNYLTISWHLVDN